MRDRETGARRAPPRVVVGSLVVSSAVLWLLVRLLLHAWGTLAPRLSGWPPVLLNGPHVSVVVCVTVTVLSLYASARAGEREFLADVGLSVIAAAALATTCAILLETALAFGLRVGPRF